MLASSSSTAVLLPRRRPVSVREHTSRASLRVDERDTCGVPGVWFFILQILSMAAVLTNTVIIYLFTRTPEGNSRLPSFLPLTQVGSVWFFMGAMCSVVALKMVVRFSTPELPQQVEDDRFRENYFHHRVRCPCGIAAPL